MTQTIYQKANEAMEFEIKRYLALTKITNGFSLIEPHHLFDTLDRLMFGAGIGLYISSSEIPSPERLIAEWKRKKAIPFDIEKAVTTGVYNSLRPFVEELFDDAASLTKDFTEFNPDILFSNTR